MMHVKVQITLTVVSHGETMKGSLAAAQLSVVAAVPPLHLTTKGAAVVAHKAPWCQVVTCNAGGSESTLCAHPPILRPSQELRGLGVMAAVRGC